MTFKRKTLWASNMTELLEVGRALELDVTTNMRLDDLMDVVAGSKKRGLVRVWVDAVNAKGGFGVWCSDVAYDMAKMQDVLAEKGG